MSNIILNFKKSKITGKEIMEYSEEIEKIHILMNKKANSKDEFLGWLNWPTKYDKKEFEKIKKCAKKIQENSEVSNSNRHRWFIFRSKSCYRSIKKFIL